MIAQFILNILNLGLVDIRFNQYSVAESKAEKISTNNDTYLRSSKIRFWY